MNTNSSASRGKRAGPFKKKPPKPVKTLAGKPTVSWGKGAIAGIITVTASLLAEAVMWTVGPWVPKLLKLPSQGPPVIMLTFADTSDTSIRESALTTISGYQV